MKRTFKRADGTEEVLEGTPEEFAEYDRKLGGVKVREQRVSKPALLKG